MPSDPAKFDHVIVVDWSANNSPKTGNDSIWYCFEGKAFNPPTRFQAMREITRLASMLDGRVLLGFDFPLGFAGYRITWEWIAGLMQDDEDNRNNRFAVAAQINCALTGGAAPFWGCPPKHAGPYLKTTKPDLELPQRATERRGAKPPWKLAYPGTCGSQTLTGVPHLLRLRQRLGDCSVWPFELESTRYVIAEVYPSLSDIDSAPAEYDRPLAGHVCKDERQVLALQAELSNPGKLRSYLTIDLPAGAREEGWILGLLP